VKFLKVTLSNGDHAALNPAHVKGMVYAEGKTIITMADGKQATVKEKLSDLLKQMERES